MREVLARRACRAMCAGALLPVLLAVWAPVGAQQPAAQETRVVATAFRQDLGQAESYETFRAAVETHFETHVAPLLAADRPNLVVYPDRFDELAALIGTRGLAARELLGGGGSHDDARQLLMAAYAQQITYYRAVYPGTGGNGRYLQLALTDTVVRAVVETFSQVAAAHRVHLVVGVALPEYEQVDGQEAEVLADPELDAASAYRAATEEVRAATLVFGPAGEVVARRDRVSVTSAEAGSDPGPGLVSAPLAELAVVELPFARLGMVAGEDAWMPDIVERYDHLGANLLVQPLRSGPWAADRLDYWVPDHFQRGTWLATQRLPGLASAVTAVATGVLGAQVLDGQAVVASAAAPADNLCLVGSEVEPGWAAVGGWADLESPAPAFCGAERRPDLRAATGRAYFDGAVSADVALPAAAGTAPGVQAGAFSSSGAVGDGEGSVLSPALAFGGGEAWLTGVRLAGNEQAVVVARAGDDGSWPGWSPVSSQGAFGGRRDHGQWSPAVVAPVAAPAETTPGLEVSPVVEPVVVYTTLGGSDWDVYASTYDREQDRWVSRRVDSSPGFFDISSRMRAHSAPAVVSRSDGSLAAVWSDLRWPYVKPQARSAHAPVWEAWSDRARADGHAVRDADTEQEPAQPHAPEPDETRGQAFPAIAVTGGDDLLVAWQERVPDGSPGIYVARSEGGDGYGPAQRVDGTPASSWRPALAADGDRVWLVWEQATDAGGRRLWLRSSEDGGRTWGASGLLDPGAPPGSVQARAAVVPVGDGRAVVAFEDGRTGQRQILAVSVAADGSGAAPVRVDDAPAGADASAPAVTRLEDGRLLVAWEDTRDGVPHVRTAAGQPVTAPAPTDTEEQTPQAVPDVLPGLGLPATGGASTGAGLLIGLVLLLVVRGRGSVR